LPTRPRAGRRPAAVLALPIFFLPTNFSTKCHTDFS
jgi:hypothetical protein